MNVLSSLSKFVPTRLASKMWKLEFNRLLKTGWRDQLELCSNSLTGLNQDTESEFLEIGQKLQDLYSRSREIAGLSSSVASLLSAGEFSDVIERVRRLPGEVRELESASKRGTVSLKDILDTLDNIHGQVAGFARIIRVLRMLCISIRIESARVGDEGLNFSILADSVAKLALEIEGKCSDLDGRSKELSTLMQNGLEKVLALEAIQRGRANGILERIIQNLELLRERHELCSSGAQVLSGRYEAVSKNIWEIVTCLQFHDITRQQIEHVTEALEHLSGKAEERSPDGTPPDSNGNVGRLCESPHHMAATCRLQAAQLCNSRDEMLAAVDGITRSLRNVATIIAEMSSETRKMTGEAGDNDESFLDAMNAEFSSLSETLAGYGRSNGEIMSLMGSLESTMDRMCTFADEIESIGTKIQLIALNAVVQAAHLGENGSSLAILAEDIHKLSTEACRKTNELSSLLRSITDRDKKNETQTGREDIASRLDALEQGMEFISHSLHTLQASLSELLSKIEEGGKNLLEGIRKTVKHMSAREKTEVLINQVVCDLDAKAGYLSAAAPAAGKDGQESLLGLASSYTMQSERRVHDSLVASPEPEVEPAGKAENNAPPTGSTNDLHTAPNPEQITHGLPEAETGVELFGEENKEEEDELGDNVELF